MSRVISEILKKEYRAYRNYTINMTLLSIVFLITAFTLNIGMLILVALIFGTLAGTGYVQYSRMRSTAIKHEYLPELLDKTKIR